MKGIMFLTLLLLNYCVSVATGCNNSATVGLDFTLPLTFKVVPTTHKLTWKRNDTSIFIKRNYRISTGKKSDTNGEGSLLLTNVGKDNAGKYIVEVMDTNTGKLVYNKEYTLCVWDNVPRPEVKTNCNSEEVTLRCTVPKAEDLKFKWSNMGKDIPEEESSETLTRPIAQLLGNRNNFTCTVSNPVSSETSTAVTELCDPERPTIHMDKGQTTVSQGSRFTIECSVPNGYPTGYLRLTLNRDPIEKERRAINNSAQFEITAGPRQGDYVCLHRLFVGENESSPLHLNVTNPKQSDGAALSGHGHAHVSVFIHVIYVFIVSILFI